MNNTKPAADNDFYFIPSSGACSASIKAAEWSGSSLGVPGEWPVSLKTALGILLASDAPMLLWWGTEFIQFHNDALQDIIKISSDKCGTMGPETPLLWKDVKQNVENVMRTGAAQVEKTATSQRDSSDADLNFSYSPVFGDTGKIEGVLARGVKPPAQPDLKADLHSGDWRYQTLLEQAGTGIIVVQGSENRVLMANDAYLQLSGADRSDMAGASLNAFFPGNSIDLLSLINSAKQSSEPVSLQEQLIAPAGKSGQGEDRFYNIICSPQISNGEGACLILFIDVTGIVLSKIKSDHLAHQVRSLVQSAPFPIGVYIGEEMRITMANESIMEVWGKGKDIVGRTYFKVLPELENQQIYTQLLDVYHKGRAFHARNQRVDLMVMDKFKTFYFNYSFTPLFDDKGKVYGVMNTAADVTDLAHAKLKLQQSEENFRNLILQAPIAMCLLLGPDHTVEVANDFMINLWGKEKNEVMNRPIFEGLPDAKEQGLEELLDNVFRTGETFTANEMAVHLIRFGSPDVVYQNFIYEPYRDGRGEILGVIAISNDVTKQVLARRRVEDVVKLRTEQLVAANENLARSNSDLAQFAYIASHDLQEPVRKISTFASMLEQRIGASIDQKSLSQIQRIGQSASRMQALIKDVLSLSQLNREIKEFQMVDLNEILRDVLADFELLITQRGAEIHADTLPVISGQAVQLTQLFSNLLGNSLKFQKPETRPVIHINAVMADHDEKVRLEFLSDMDYVKITLRDNGIGFNEDQADKIFGIFERLHNKSQFEGTGIGLSICKKIVHNHNGEINVQGSSENGAVFNIYLPLEASASRGASIENYIY